MLLSSLSMLPSRIRRAAFGVACLSLAAACSGDTPSAPSQDDATRAVDLFVHLADSVSRSGGDSDVGGAYASVAEAVRQGGRISRINIAVDGVATTFLATAQQTEILVTPCASQICTLAARVMTRRTLIAWQPDDPRRVVQLSSEADTDPIRAYLYPGLVAYSGPSASLIFFDGNGGTYFGTSGSQKFGVTTSTTPCPAAGGNRPITAMLIFPVPPRCTEADFSITFTGKAEPSTFLANKNTATGSHSFFMLAQPVLGARFEFTAALPPLPPIVVTPSVSLPATLSAKIDSLVTLTLTVSNPASTPAQVAFNSGQHYDFTISDAANGALLWRWSLGMGFTQVLSTQTIPANGTLVYTAQWKPTQKGNLIAAGSLVSLSHRADAKMFLMMP
jgi:hypothetical protein